MLVVVFVSMMATYAARDHFSRDFSEDEQQAESSSTHTSYTDDSGCKVLLPESLKLADDTMHPRRKALVEELERWYKHDTPEELLVSELVLQQFNLKPKITRLATQFPRRFVDKYQAPDLDTYALHIDQDTFSQLGSKIKAGDTEALKHFIVKHQLTKASFVSVNKKATSTLSYAASSFDLSEQELLVLIDSGIPVTKDDIAFFISHFSDDFVLSMFEVSEHLENEILFNNDKLSVSSYAFLAIEAKRLELAAHFINKGSASFPDMQHFGVIDYIASNLEQFDSVALALFFDSIKNQTPIVRYESSIARLNENARPLPEKYLLADEFARLSSTTKTKGYKEQLLTRTVFTTDEMRDLTQYKKDCRLEYLATTFESVFRTKAPPPDLKSILTLANVNINIEPNSPIEKKANNEAQRLNIINESAAAFKKSTEEISTPELKATIEEIYQLARQKKWPEAEILVEDLSEDTAEIFSALITIAIQLNEDVTTIARLISNGGELNSFHTFLLIAADNRKLANDLNAYGLDIHFVDTVGRDTVQTAVNMKSYAMAEFLLQQGVETRQDDGVYDALDYVLLGIGSEKDVKAISMILNYGVELKASHRYLSEQLKKNNFELYMLLIQEVPALG